MSGINAVPLLAALALTLVAVALPQTSVAVNSLPDESACLLGIYEYTLAIPLTSVNASPKLIVDVSVTVRHVGINEYLVTAKALLEGPVKISFTPPLIDLIVHTNSGTYVWSKGRVFAQVVINAVPPINSSVSLRVKGSCVKSVEVLVTPVHKDFVFTPTLTYVKPMHYRGAYLIMVLGNGSVRVSRIKSLSGGEAASIIKRHGLVPYKLTVNYNLMVNNEAVISKATITVYAPKGLNASLIRRYVEPILRPYSRFHPPSPKPLTETPGTFRVLVHSTGSAESSLTTRYITCSSATTVSRRSGVKALVTRSVQTLTAPTTTAIASTTSSAAALSTQHSSIVTQVTRSGSASSVASVAVRRLGSAEALAIAACAAVIAGLIAYAALKR